MNNKNKMSQTMSQKPVNLYKNVNNNYSDDDLGVDFLANPTRTKNVSRPQSPTNVSEKNYSTVPQYPLPPQQADPLPEINVSKLPDHYDRERRGYADSDHGSYHHHSDSYDENESASDMSESGMNPQDILREKRTLLFKLKRYEKKGYKLSRTYSLHSTLEDIRSEYESIRREANLEQGLKVSKNLLISACSLLEYLNNRFDPMDVVLDGWSEEVHEDVEDNVYDEVLEELYYKYYDKVSLGPELKLLTMLGGSAVKFHMTQTLLKTMVPDAETLLKQNPNLKNEIVSLVNKTEQGKEFQKQLNNLHKGSVQGLGSPQQDMSGPSDVDDILAELENETNNVTSTNQIMQDGVMDITF